MAASIGPADYPRLPLHLYLQERWGAVSAEEPDTEKCRQRIMADYLGLGIAGRWKYHEQANQLKAQRRWQQDREDQSSTPPIDTSTFVALPELRCKAEWQCANLLDCYRYQAWVRTSYSRNNFLDTLLKGDNYEYLGRVTWSHNFDTLDSIPIIDAPETYEGLTLEQIINLMPELAESYWSEPTFHQEMIQERLQDIAARLDALEAEGIEDEEDLENYRDEILLDAQDVFVTGCFWVQDAYADEHHKVLLVWVDQYGRPVRTKRVNDPVEYAGLLESHIFTDCPWWNTAKVSDLYNPLPDEDIDALNAVVVKEPLDPEFGC